MLCISEALQGIFLNKLMLTYLSLPVETMGKALVLTMSMIKLHFFFSEDQGFTQKAYPAQTILN